MFNPNINDILFTERRRRPGKSLFTLNCFKQCFAQPSSIFNRQRECSLKDARFMFACLM